LGFAPDQADAHTKKKGRVKDFLWAHPRWRCKWKKETPAFSS